MKLVRFEFLKVITSKLFIITFLILASINFAFLSYGKVTDSKNAIPYSAYHLLESDLKNKTMQEKEQFINDIYERVNGINLIYTIQSNLSSENRGYREFAESLREENKDIYNKYKTQANNNPTFKYTNDIDKELAFLEQIKNEFDKENNYKGAINDILNEAEDLQGISIFKQTNDEISLKNITRTTNVYKDMLNTKIDYSQDLGIEKFTSVAITDFLVLIIVFIASTILITEEKEKNLFTIIKSTKNGGAKTIISKITALFILVLFASILFYGMNFLYYFITIGYGNLGATIQSLPMFMLSTIKINVLEYMLLFFTSKILVMFLISCIILYLAVKFNNSSETIMGIVFILLISFLIYKGDYVNSNINLLKSFNLISLVDVNNAYNIYGNLQLGNLLFEKTKTLLILQIIFVILFISLSVIKYVRSMSITTKENILLSKISNIKILKKFQINSIFGFECYKLLFESKALIIILLFGLFLGYNYKNQNFNLSSSELFYKSYMEVLEGNLTPEKELIIENSRKEYENAREQINKIDSLALNGELSIQESNYAKMPYEDILATENIFERTLERYEYIKEHPSAKFVYDTGYNKLFRIDSKMVETDIYLIIVTILSVIGLFIMEYKTGFIHILNATKKGRNITAKRKILATILIGTILYLISITPEILYTLKVYGLNSLSSGINSISYFAKVNSNMPILVYMILFYVVRYVSYIMIIFIIEYISLLLKNQVFAIFTSACLLTLPFILCVLKFTDIVVLPFINLSWIIGESSKIIYLPIMVIIMIFLYNNIVKRLE